MTAKMLVYVGASEDEVPQDFICVDLQLSSVNYQVYVSENSIENLGPKDLLFEICKALNVCNLFVADLLIVTEVDDSVYDSAEEAEEGYSAIVRKEVSKWLESV